MKMRKLLTLKMLTFIGLFFLVLAIPVTLLLSQQQQNTKQNAAEPTVDPITQNASPSAETAVPIASNSASVGVPTNLRAECKSATQVTVSWSPGNNAVHHLVHLNDGTNADEYTNAHTFTVTTGKEYSWWMEAASTNETSDSVAGPVFRCGASTTTAPSTPPAASGETTILIRLKNEKGEPVTLNSGTIFVSNQSGSDSDNMNLAGAESQQCFKKLSEPGQYRCTKYADSWFAGMGSTGAPSGYCVIDGGNRQDEGEAPLPLAAGNALTIDVILRQGSCGGGTGGINPQTNPAYVPDCSNVQGPTTVRIGQSVTYLAQYSGPENARLLGTINAVKTTNTTPTEANSWDWNDSDTSSPSKNFPPKEVTGGVGSLSYTWQPKSAGVYQVFCRAWNSTNGNVECRGALNTVDGAPRYACTGQGAVLTVNVTSAEILTTASGTDMCQMAMTVGGNVISPQGAVNNPNAPITLAAIPKPGFNIKQYTFAFYNQDNNPADPKPIQFEPGKQFVIDSPGNNISLRYEDISRPDLNNDGKLPTNIQVNAYFTDATGKVSAKSPNCTTYISLVNPTPTQVIPTTTPVFSPSPETNRTGLLATVGVLIIAVIVSLNFFFS